ncbi:MAG: hypothetical protein HQL43_06810 [Alphaproteobacteria bacterium]|nr:hypothetical protein [Alphaproteobacteria bacterium]
MAVPNLFYFTLADLCERWDVKLPHIGALVLDGKLTISVGLSGVPVEVGEWFEVDTGEWQRLPSGWKHLTGIFDLSRNDAWAVIKHGLQAIESVVPIEPDNYIEIRRQDGHPEFVVAVDDLLIRRLEVERFEASNALSSSGALEASARRSGPGAPQKYDWDGFWIEACRHVHDEGIPSTQAAMVRDLLDWFDAKGGSSPDPSTVKKKVSRLWKALHPSASSSSRRSGDEGEKRADSAVA